MSDLSTRPLRITRYREASLWDSLRFDFLVVAAIVLLTFLLYAPSLRYPFAWYDANDLVHALKHMPAELLAGVPHYPYYRPLVWLFWKLVLTLWADRAAPLMYAYLIGVHLLNGVLLWPRPCC